jgi:2-polyprenyl-3-methyl-5-hydroxy-6-metoxy-1,4-benzoquinol methylase
MGLDINSIKLLIKTQSLGVNFKKVITIGRQGMHLGPKELTSVLNKSGLKINSNNDAFVTEKYAEGFLKLLGAEVTDSLDASAYEHATHIHDLNLPISKNMKSKYSVVIDGGSLEHVFNFPIAIKNCMELIKLHGHFIGITPTNNFCGHGFYQFSPELYYRVFNASNGFKLVKMYFYVDDRTGKAIFYEVMDPLQLKERVTLVNAKRSYLFVIAQKLEEKELFKIIPQQSDYEHLVWTSKSYESVHTSNVIKFQWIKKLLPLTLKRKMHLQKRKLVKFYNRHVQATGDSNPLFFKKMNENGD